MKKKTNQLEEIYRKLKRELVEKTIFDMVISAEKEAINYKPNYQRNYIWNITKAVSLIETVLINSEIPPITVIKNEESIEVIDGRQRYETLLRFYNNEFPLKISGLDKLKGLRGKYYKDLPNNIKKIFQEYKLKLIVYTADISISQNSIEMIKRDLFKRYNSGLTALKKCEVARAKYIHDYLTQKLVELFEKNTDLYSKCINVLLPRTKRNIENREKINLLLVTIREMLIMPYIPIIGEKTIKVGANNLDKYYTTFITSLNEKEKEEKINEFVKIFKKLYLIKEKLKDDNNDLQDNIMFFKSTYWMLSLLYETQSDEFYKFNINQFCHYVENGGQNYFESYKNITSSHIESRHSYMKKYINEELQLNIEEYLNRVKNNKKSVNNKRIDKVKSNVIWNGIGSDKQLMTTRDSMKISEIIKFIKDNRFIVRPKYQRAEVKNRKKASRVIESIILGVKLPPIYVYVRREQDGLDRFIVLDGQQRLIDILKFMGEPITDEQYNYIETYKDKYALCGLKDIEGLNGKVYEEGKNGINQFKREPIQNYEMEIIRIDEQANPKFDSVDMFLRLNQNPCPIGMNNFEMWNSFDIINSINKIKEIAKYKLFKQLGNRMQEEELVTTLAYMNLRDITIENMRKFFKMCVHIENKNKQNQHIEIKLSIANKSAISNYLENLEADSNDEKNFLQSINAVNNFVDKLKILSEEDEDILIKIFNPNINTPRKGSKNDFYIMWLILKKIDTHIIKTYKKDILKDVKEIFRLMKNMPENKEVDSFINYIKNIVDKYYQYSS